VGTKRCTKPVTVVNGLQLSNTVTVIHKKSVVMLSHQLLILKAAAADIRAQSILSDKSGTLMDLHL